MTREEFYRIVDDYEEEFAASHGERPQGIMIEYTNNEGVTKKFLIRSIGVSEYPGCFMANCISSFRSIESDNLGLDLDAASTSRRNFNISRVSSAIIIG